MKTIDINDTLRHALSLLESLSGTKSLIVTCNGGIMAATLTDGDVRRGLLAGATLNDTVGRVCHRDFTALRPGDDSVATVARCRRLGIRLLPVLDTSGRPCHIYDLDTLDTIVPLRALLMAGGRGQRLRPLTDTTPKPLLPVGGIPIIDRNITLLRRAGIRDITISTGYMSERFDEHFADDSGITLLHESSPLGTIGAMSAMPAATCDTLVMNADLLTGFSIERMYLTHRRSHADITVGTVPYTISIPYAVIDTDTAGHVTALHEKPTRTYAANAGIYIISPGVAGSIDKGKRLDAPDLINDVISRDGVVATYSIDGRWLDIGTPADYARADSLLDAL